MTSQVHEGTAQPAADQARATRSAAVPTWGLGLALVALHLAVTLQVRPGPRWNDAIFVLNDARDYPHVPLDHHALRIGNLLPARLFLELFGYGQVAYYAWPFLTGILLVLATFALGTALFGRWAGAAAAVLIIFHPVLVLTDIRYGVEHMVSWHLLPDLPSAAFVTAGFALLVTGAKRRDADGTVTASSWWFLGAGLCFGWAYLVRELIVFIYPAVAGALLGWRLPRRRWVQVAAPMLGCLVLELALATAVYHDPLARLQVGAEHVGAPPTGFTRMDAVLRLPRAVHAYPQTVVVLATIALTVLGAVVTRRREHVLPLGWFVSFWVPLTLESGLADPHQIHLNASLIRYWVPVLPALCIGAAGAVSVLLRRLPGWVPAALRPAVNPARAVGVGAALLACCVPMLGFIVHNPRDGKWNAVRVWLHRHDPQVDTVVTDERDALTLGVYRNQPLGGRAAWHARIEKVHHGQPQSPRDPRAAGTVLLWTPYVSRRPPTADLGWRLVYSRPELRLYVSTAFPA